jgi:hypothetical protein
MKTYETWLQIFLAIGFLIGAVHYALWRMRYLARLDEGALIGFMKDWEIRVVDDPKEGRCVGIAIDLKDASAGRDERIYAVFSPAQARQLAQWLRIAAAPGRTLSVARLNVNKNLGP